MKKTITSMKTKAYLDENISLDNFKNFYWLKKELISLCRTLGISTSGGKIEISNRIEYFLKTGSYKQENQKIKKTSNFNWKTENLTAKTIITDSYKNNANVRAFFIKKIGTHFKFNVRFLSWMKSNYGKTLEDAITEWKRIVNLKKDTSYKTKIAPQFEYNTYTRDFFSDNPKLKLKDAIKFWKLKKAIKGHNKYERSDLNLKAQ